MTGVMREAFALPGVFTMLAHDKIGLMEIPSKAGQKVRKVHIVRMLQLVRN